MPSSMFVCVFANCYNPTLSIVCTFVNRQGRRTITVHSHNTESIHDITVKNIFMNKNITFDKYQWPHVQQRIIKYDETKGYHHSQNLARKFKPFNREKNHNFNDCTLH